MATGAGWPKVLADPVTQAENGLGKLPQAPGPDSRNVRRCNGPSYGRPTRCSGGGPGGGRPVTRPRLRRAAQTGPGPDGAAAARPDVATDRARPRGVPAAARQE